MLTNCKDRKHQSFSFKRSILERYDENALMDKIVNIAGTHVVRGHIF